MIFAIAAVLPPAVLKPLLPLIVLPAPHAVPAAPLAAASALPSPLLLAGLVENLNLNTDATDYYYAFLAVLAVGYGAKQALASVFEAATAADALVEEKGRAGAALANKLDADRRKARVARKRADQREAEPATAARLEAEKKMRDQKRAGWRTWMLKPDEE